MTEPTEADLERAREIMRATYYNWPRHVVTDIAKAIAETRRAERKAALDEAAEIARNEEEPHPAEMPAEIIARVLAQDTTYVASAIVGAIRVTKKNIAAAIESLPKDRP